MQEQNQPKGNKAVFQKYFNFHCCLPHCQRMFCCSFRQDMLNNLILQKAKRIINHKRFTLRKGSEKSILELALLYFLFGFVCLWLTNKSPTQKEAQRRQASTTSSWSSGDQSITEQNHREGSWLYLTTKGTRAQLLLGINNYQMNGSMTVLTGSVNILPLSSWKEFECLPENAKAA